MTDHPPARRAPVVAAALAALLLSGLAACGTSVETPPPDPGESSAPSGQRTEPVGTGSPGPTVAGRSVTADNVLTVDDIYSDDPMTKEVVQASDGDGRPVSQSYICLPPDGLASLGATAMVNRDFTYKIIDAGADPYPDSPLKNKPSIYTQALQFPDEAAATAARTAYADWIENCPATLTERGYQIDAGQSLKLTTLKIEGAASQAGMVAYVEPGAEDTENLYWESAGVTQVGDRLMTTVSLTWGPDTPGTFDTTDGDFINPQVILAEIGAEALAR